jgi:hypothetical protein
MIVSISMQSQENTSSTEKTGQKITTLEQKCDSLHIEFAKVKENKSKIQRDTETIIEDYKTYISRIDTERHIIFAILALLIAIAGLISRGYILRASKIAVKALAKELNTNEATLKEALEDKAYELRLKQDFNLYIITSETHNKQKLDTIFKMFVSFGFQKPMYYSGRNSLTQNDVVMFLDYTKEKEKNERVSLWLKDQTEIIDKYKSACAMFYVNMNKLQHNFENDVDAYGSANSNSTIYNNLMSLLHYKKFLNENNQKTNFEQKLSLF